MSNGGSRELLCVKANKPLFYSYYTANKTTCRNIQALFIASATEILEFAHTVYFHPTKYALHLFVAMVTQSYCTMAGDKEFIIILKR